MVGVKYKTPEEEAAEEKAREEQERLDREQAQKNWEEAQQKIKDYHEKYKGTGTPLSNRFHREYAYQNDANRIISIYSKYWMDLLEKNPYYKDLYSPYTTVINLDAEEIEEVEKQQAEKNRLVAKVKELSSKLGQEWDEKTEVRGELDKLARNMQLLGISEKEFLRIKQSNQDLLKKIYQAEVENYVLHSNPPTPLSQIIRSRTEELLKEINKLKERKDSGIEQKRLELINGYLKRKLAGDILSQVEDVLLDILENKTLEGRSLQVEITEIKAGISTKRKIIIVLESWEKIAEKSWNKFQTQLYWEELINKYKK